MIKKHEVSEANGVTKLEVRFRIEYHIKQLEIFFDTEARFKIISKGRRFGLTRGMMNYVIDRAITEKNQKILWMDTTYGNIQRYIQRYGFPILKKIPNGFFRWNRTNNQINIILEDGNEAIIDFRSSDRPENIEGFGYNLVIVNEAGIVLKNENLWTESIRPMMLDYRADAIIGGTPKGKRVKGKEHLFYKLAKKCEKEKDWVFLNYSSYDNPMLEKAEVDEYVSEISPALRDQEIFGLFVDADSERIIKREWFVGQAQSRKVKVERGIIIQSWDTAFKKNEENDYSVCTTWKVEKSEYYLIDIFRERLEFPELKRKVIELNAKYKSNLIIIEDKASGISLIQELKRETRLPIKAVKVSTDKVSRVHSITPLLESGNVVLSEAIENIDIFLNECEDFPNGEFDDMVDSMSQFLEYIRTANVNIEAPKVTTKKYLKKKLYNK